MHVLVTFPMHSLKDLNNQLEGKLRFLIGDPKILLPKLVIDNNIETVDLTGGAPEINKYFRYLIKELRQHDIRIIDRCNLTILNEDGMKDLPSFFVKHKTDLTKQ